MPRVLTRAVKGYLGNDCPLAAAAIAYYVLLSSFPLLLLITVFGAILLPRQLLERSLIDFVNEFLAGSTSLVTLVIRDLNRHLTSITLLALAGTVWSGQAVFGAIRTALNQAWGVHEKRGFWHQRRLEVTFALLIGILFVLSSFVTWGLDRYGSEQFAVALRLLSASLISLAGFTLCYELLPDFPRRTWAASLKAGLVATVLFELAKWIFLAYLHLFANYSLVYGTVGTVVVFLIWAYATASILLFGAQLASEWERVEERLPEAAESPA
jgi:membrane protein